MTLQLICVLGSGDAGAVVDWVQALARAAVVSRVSDLQRR